MQYNEHTHTMPILMIHWLTCDLETLRVRFFQTRENYKTLLARLSSFEDKPVQHVKAEIL